jgi:CxxC motif-containing protein (DUF1111 family)
MGWKAQTQSILIFTAEAFAVEQGITNEIFPIERYDRGCPGPTPTGGFGPTPELVTNVTGATPAETVSAVEAVAFFQRFLADLPPSTDTPGGADSIARGRAAFSSIGCAHCHTPQLNTRNTQVAALSNKPVNLYSDLALHNMGPALADDIVQGLAAGDEFRTAPLWGLGYRIFFLHDGRTKDLVQAIQAHRSNANERFAASEANKVIANYDALPAATRQDLLNFLRSL